MKRERESEAEKKYTQKQQQKISELVCLISLSCSGRAAVLSHKWFSNFYIHILFKHLFASFSLALIIISTADSISILKYTRANNLNNNLLKTMYGRRGTRQWGNRIHWIERY